MSAILPAITIAHGSGRLLPDRQACRQVIERARWAPSGDNTQPWRFVLAEGARFAVIGRDTRDEVVYDRDGRASQLSLGALLESIRLAASEVGRRALITPLDGDQRQPRWMVALVGDPAARPDPLATQLRRRCTSRLPFSTRALPTGLRSGLEAALGPCHRALWLTGARRLRAAWLNAGFGRIRLIARECYQVHRHIIDWDDRFSMDRLPVDSLGLDPLTRRIMRWALADWQRAELLNRLGCGTQPRWQLDLLPAVRCGAIVAVAADRDPDSLDAQLAAGAAVQRLWLAATAAGLQLQPLYTPVVLGRYVREGRRCFAADAPWRTAQTLTARWDRLVGDGADRLVFAARLGFAAPPPARSIRLAMDEVVMGSGNASTPPLPPALRPG
ncbi:MAG: molybdopterin biosynthesis protein MoeY [Planctomycetes bacterium]|nr:molybdopterin biosynthesis protein MoeY [Planctomycetota bacterium]